MKTKNTIIALDILKIFACLSVIMNHVIEFIKDDANHSISGALFYSLNFSLYKSAVPIFIMITGVLLLRKERSYQEIGKKIVRVFIPLFCLSLLIYTKETTSFSLWQFLLLFLKDPIKVPYWYLYMLIPIYLMTPFIQKMIQNFKKIDYLVFSTIVLLLPSLLNLISVYTPITFSQSFFMAYTIYIKLKFKRKWSILVLVSFSLVLFY